jgi:hypothetical protein
MSNKLASVSLSASYSDPDDQRAALARINVDAPYMGQSHNGIDVPDQTDTGVEFTVDFGSIDTEATLLVVRNLTANGMYAGQDLLVKINGTAVPLHLPPGGFIAFGNPVAAGDEPLVSMTLTTTDAGKQDGPGKIATHVFGDPV